MMHKGFHQRAWAFAIWIASCGVGFSWLASYALSPGDPGDAVIEATVLEIEASKHAEGARLMMFVHPRCSCSAASLDELREVMARAGDSIESLEFFVAVPDSASARQWEVGGLIGRLEAWGPNVTVHRDHEGREASQFGARTSGHVIAWDTSGQPIFTGGITGSRGHRGDNPGRRQLLEALHSHVSSPGIPVFGCGLQTDSRN